MLIRFPLPALVAVVLIVAAPTHAQGFEIPPVGSDDTFNVATWNIEHFGTSGPSSGNTEVQFANVLSVMEQANVHLWALQEMNSQSAFNALVAELGDGWAGFWQPDQTQFAIGYGYIYRTHVVQPVHTTTILTQHAHAFAFRPPLLMRAHVTLPTGTVENVRFINIHAKCCGSLQDWTRRRDASVALKEYVDELVDLNQRVLILGDLNDEIRISISSGRPSPYANFRNDPENYHFGTLSLEDANINTWCGNASCTSGSTIDHVLITAPLFGDYEEDSTARYDALLQNIPNYRSSTSDHVAVYARFDFSSATSGEGTVLPGDFRLDAPYPNPFRNHATVTFMLPESAEVRVEVYDALGRRVAVVDQGSRAPGEHEVLLSGRNLSSGLYLVRLSAHSASGERSATRRLVRLP